MIWIAAGIFFLIAGVYLLAQTFYVQSLLAHRVATYLSTELKTTVRIDKVQIRFLKSILLGGLYVEDLHHDTLLFAKELKVDLNELRFRKHILGISNIKLSAAKFFLTRYHGEDFDNIQFISDYFSSADTTVSVPWKVSFGSLELSEVQFRHDVEDDTLLEHGVDFAHLNIKNINGEFDKIRFVNDSVFARISNLQFADRSGFRVDEFSGDAKVSSTQIRIKNFVVRTPQTTLNTDLIFNYTKFSDFDDFLKKVQFTSSFKHTSISFDDIAYFATDLWGFNLSLKLEGNFKGAVNNFRGNHVTIEFGNHTRFRGSVSLTGLPNIEETYFDVLADEITSSREDVEMVPVAPFGKGNHVVLPAQVGYLGEIFFKGKFSGFYNDFVAYGNINTALGYLSTDINMKYNAAEKKEYYSGNLSVQNFNVGAMLNSSDLGLTSFNADIKGSGMRLDNVAANMKGVVSLLQFKNYSYRNIQVDGMISNKLFSGSLNIDEPNAGLNFAGQINFTKTLPQFNLVLDVDHLHLDTLNLFHLEGETEAGAHIEFNFEGNTADNIIGTMLISNFDYHSDKTLYHINNIMLNAGFQNNKRNIEITSDNVDATFTGQIDFATLPDDFNTLLREYIPALAASSGPSLSRQNFSFGIRLKNTSLITERFLPDWSIEPNTNVKGNFDNNDNHLHISVTSPFIRYKSFRFLNEELNIDAETKNITLNSKASRVYYSDSSYIERQNIGASASENKVDFVLQLADTVLYPNRANFKGAFTFYSSRDFLLHFNEAVVVLDSKPWEMDALNNIRFDSSGIAASHIVFSGESGMVSADGKVSHAKDDKLNLAFQNFNLANLNYALRKNNIKLNGMLDGTASLTNAYSKPQVVSDLTVQNFSFNDELLGNAEIKSRYDAESESVKADITVTKGTAKTIFITGEYIAAGAGNLDFNIELRNIYLPPFEKYINSVVSDVKGKISADLKLSGTFAHPLLLGYVDFQKTSVIVNYLNTRYNLNDRVTVGDNFFGFNDFVLADEQGNKAFANGRINHTFFTNFFFDINVETKKFHALNTNATQNDLYYGTAFVSGTASFNGSIELMNMDMHLTSERGTEIHIPLTSTSEVEHGDYITFRKKNSDTTEVATIPKVNISGITMNMMLDVNPEALLEIIFDEKIGDKISGSGYSNLQLKIDQANGFRMFGTFNISKGNYLFTLRNVINKKYNITPGGTITWNGDPYDADVNLSALYSGSTSTLYKMLDDSTFRRRINYEVELSLSNKLMNPTVNYSINVLGLDGSAQSQVRSKLNSEAEVSKQVFGLMWLGQFLPPSGEQSTSTIEAGTGAGATASELLSNQVTNWLSQLSPKFGLGFNYKSGETYTKDEWDVLFSKSLFNERLALEGNVGVASDQTTRSVVGDFNAEYSVSESGKFKLKAFNRSNINNTINYNSPYTQGVGFLYREQFNSLHQLMQRYGLAKKKEKQQQ